MESGELLAPGEKKSDETGCKISECKLINGKPSTIVESAVCPAIPTDCPAKFLVPDQTGCCQVCSKPEKLSKIEKYFILFLKTSLLRKLCCHFFGGADTVGVVELYIPGHGPCKNVEPVLEWKRCQGQCTSGSFFVSGWNTARIFKKSKIIFQLKGDM